MIWAMAISASMAASWCRRPISTPWPPPASAAPTAMSRPRIAAPRAGLLTGRYQTRFGHEFNPHAGDEATLGLPLDQRTLADYLHDAGYATGAGRQVARGLRCRPSSAVARLRRVLRLSGRHAQLYLAQGCQADLRHRHSQNMIYRGREVQKLDGYHDRSVHRRGDRFHRSPSENPGSCTWPTTPFTRRWRSSRSTGPHSGQRDRSGPGVMARCCWASTTASAE